MRNSLVPVMLASLVLLALSPAAKAQGPRKPPPGFIAAGIPEMPNPPGPAPTHDLTGAWVGPFKIVMGPYPEMTDAGKAVMSHNHPVPEAGQRPPGTPEGGVSASNDPFMICDPLGVPRDLLNHAISMRGAIEFQPLSNRMLMLFEQQRIWREIWMDGRQLPAKVDAAGAPDSRYYGYSVGHWDGDTTFVIDTVGLDPRSWLDEKGHPHTKDAKVQERWVRLDQYNVQATVTVDDPKFYTKPFQLMQTNYYWMKDQNFEETLCIPSEGIEYRDKLAQPSGWSDGAGNKESK